MMLSFISEGGLPYENYKKNFVEDTKAIFWVGSTPEMHLTRGC